ncbi:acetyl-CoA carboxylase biotin carboxyl carrier protein [Chloroflexia bacterium SDU3-3]|nr:acetyl-CoA carboxylase biotin carboxyl carrier protein [Chloroflexia bacterium SDU3-3]
MTDMPQDQQGSADEFGLEAVRELLRLISATDVTEIQIERGATKLHIKRGQQVAAAPAPSFAPAPSSTAAAAPAAAPAAGHAAPAEYEPPAGSSTIVSPMVGTFYSASTPKDPAFVNEGDLIQAGDVVGIVEAMKIMNEVDSEFSGRIARILVTNGQPVEYGQPLMIIEPA